MVICLWKSALARRRSNRVVCRASAIRFPIAGRAGSAERYPDLPADGRTAGKLQNSHVALVTYEMPSEKISLLVVSSKYARIAGGEEVRSGNLTFHYRSRANFKVITWANPGLTYAMVSSL